MVLRKRLDLTGPAMAFVTTTVKDWAPVFANDLCSQALRDQLHDTLGHYQVSLCGYVIMPSHLHALLGFREIERMSQVMQSLKSLAARRVRPLLPHHMVTVFDRAGRFMLWKPRFDDLIIWSEKQFRTKLEYIHDNPVRAGLVTCSSDYLWSSAGDWLLDRPRPLLVDREWVWLGNEGS